MEPPSTVVTWESAHVTWKSRAKFASRAMQCKGRKKMKKKIKSGVLISTPNVALELVVVVVALIYGFLVLFIDDMKERGKGGGGKCYP